MVELSAGSLVGSPGGGGTPASLWVLLASNLVPLIGVLAFGWDLGLILLLYWAESAVILLFSLLKMVAMSGAAGIVLVPFFILHAGIFMLVHLVFLVSLFVRRPDGGWLDMARDLLLALAALVGSHLFSFVANFRRKGETYGKPQDVMGGFYGRILVMHVTIIFGAFLIGLLGSPVWALVLLIALKTGVDGMAHLRERRKRAPAAVGTGPPSAS